MEPDSGTNFTLNMSVANFTANDTEEEQDELLSTQLFPIWVLCETTSGLLTLLVLYVFIVLIRHTKKQSASRLARRQRDSVLYPARYMQNNSSAKIPEWTSTAQRSSDESEQQQQAPSPTDKVPYREQISVESTRSNSNLIPSHANNKREFVGTNVIAVQRVKGKDRGAWLLRAIVLCAFVVVLRGILEQALILMGHFSDNICDIFTKIMVAFTALSLHCCHVFLWLRQLTFYSNPVLKPLRSRRLKILSYAAFAIMPITLAITLGLYMWWRDYETVGGICMASSHQNLPTYVPFAVLVACTVTIQILLSSLFLYPLLHHKMKRRRVGSAERREREADGPSHSTVAVAPKSRKSDKLMACIKRVLQGATVGITTDVVGGLVSMFLPDNIPMYAYSVLYNLNVTLNVLCLIYTFANWRQMLFPWCCPSRIEREFRASKRRRRSSARGERVKRRSYLDHRNGSLKKNGVGAKPYRMTTADS